jgi:hypothetical protein
MITLDSMTLLILEYELEVNSICIKMKVSRFF